MPNSALTYWISHHAIELNPADPGPAIDKLLAALPGEIDILALGEPTHMMEIFLDFRNKIFQHLVAHHNYTAIAIESSFPRASIINRYIGALPAGGSATCDQIQFTGFSHNLGPLAGNRALIEWMRDYNASHARKLFFHGCDAPTEMMYTDSPRILLHFALDYLAAVDAESAADLRPRIDALLGPDAAWENPRANFDPAQSIGRSPAALELAVLAEKLFAHLSADSNPARLEALHHAQLARQLLAYHAAVAEDRPDRIARLLALRDEMMAGNILSLLARERQRAAGKLFVFAHNSHLQRGTARWQLGQQLLAWTPAGALVHSHLGSRFVNIAAALNTINNAAPEAETLESHLAAAHSALIIPTAPIAPLDLSYPPIPVRTPPNPGYFPLTDESVRNFDALTLL